MNIYRIYAYSKDIITAADYDYYDSAIVAATCEEEAQMIHPGKEEFELEDNWWKDGGHYSWVRSPSKVLVEYIGRAKDGTKQGVILSSFNAG